MTTITTKVKQVHGVYYQGGVEIVEKGEKRMLWCVRVRFTKDDAFNDAVILKEELEVDNDKKIQKKASSDRSSTMDR